MKGNTFKVLGDLEGERERGENFAGFAIRKMER